MKTLIESTLESSDQLSDRNLARKIRMTIMDDMVRYAADGYGILGHPTGSDVNYGTRNDRTMMERGGKKVDKTLYGVGLPEPKKVEQISKRQISRSLSTRYSPDRPGVQAKRVADGVTQDPITGKIYDWAEGFTSESGEVFSGGAVNLQTDLQVRD